LSAGHFAPFCLSSGPDLSQTGEYEAEILPFAGRMLPLTALNGTFNIFKNLKKSSREIQVRFFWSNNLLFFGDFQYFYGEML
jgi:hypothetical protein